MKREVSICVHIESPAARYVGCNPQVLRAFRLLHRACRNLFQNDHEAMNGKAIKIF